MSTSASIEQRRRRREYQKRRKKKIKKLIGIAMGVICLIIAILLLINTFSDNTYNSEEEFQEYVAEYYSEHDYHRASGLEGEAEELSFGESLSLAVRYPQIGNSVTDTYLGDVVKEFEQSFKKKYQDIEDDAKALDLIDYAIYQSPKKVNSVVLVEEEQKILKGEVTVEGLTAHAYNFSSETGGLVSGIQMFNVGYKDSISKYIDEHLQNKYDGKLLKGYQDYTKSSDDTLNEYVLIEQGVLFLFQPGTVLAKEEGIVEVLIPYEDLEGVIRDKINFRAIDPSKPMVALTFDDGPNEKTSNRILDCLEKNGVVATFFELGRNVKTFPEVIKREAELGMEIGSHSWSHPELTKLTKKEIKKELNKTNEAIKSACGQYPTLLRPPYGSTNETVEEIANLPVILWSVDTLDWKSRKAKSVVKVIKKVEKEDGLDGRVILMHSIYDSTAKATEQIVPWLQKKGYQLVTVSELLQYRYNEKPQKGKLYGYGYFYVE